MKVTIIITITITITITNATFNCWLFLNATTIKNYILFLQPALQVN
jgi:hypothetical protein